MQDHWQVLLQHHHCLALPLIYRVWATTTLVLHIYRMLLMALVPQTIQGWIPLARLTQGYNNMQVCVVYSAKVKVRSFYRQFLRCDGYRCCLSYSNYATILHMSLTNYFFCQLLLFEVRCMIKSILVCNRTLRILQFWYKKIIGYS